MRKTRNKSYLLANIRRLYATFYFKLMLVFSMLIIILLVSFKYNLYFFNHTITAKAITPNIKINIFELEDLANLNKPKLALTTVPQKWKLVYFMPTICDATCEHNKQELNTVVNKIGNKKIAALTGSNKQLELQEIGHEALVFQDNRVFIINPDNNAIMYYNNIADATSILNDLRKILK